ncbi:WD40 repeat domain-containing protein [Streptomyces phaeoluteigriseus]|uniref:WD40 repeat domain-containing protein n=1 Tax=Streptomyces phaeoluteigriseus TaxID=114686 RepID=UPI000928B00A|nr:WD40 repeat domain-containing protein [Streptomyces phaeoluteigriseus]
MASKGAVWHRADLEHGIVSESHDLGVTHAFPVDVRPDGQQVAFVHRGSLALRTATGRFLWKRRGGWSGARFLAGADRIVASSVQGVVAEFDTSSGEEIARMRGFPPLSISGDGRLLSFRPDRDHVALWDRTAGRELARWTAAPLQSMPTGAGELLGTRLTGGNTVELFCLEPGARRPRWSVSRRISGQGVSRALAVCEERETVLVHMSGTGREQSAIHEHRLDDGSQAATHQLSHGRVRFSADGQRAVLWNGAVFSAWSTAAGREHRTSVGHDAAIDAVVCSPDGSLTATAGNDSTIRVWSTHTGEPRQVFGGALGVGLSPRFSADGRLLLATSRYGDQKWCRRLTDGTPEVFPFRLPPATRSWHTSADGQLLWTQTATGTWETRSRLIRRADEATLWHTEGKVPGPNGAVFTGNDVLTLEWEFTYGHGHQPRVVRLRAESGYRAEPVMLQGLARLSPNDDVVFGGNGDFLALRSQGQIVVFDIRDGRVLGQLECPTDIMPVFAGSRWLLSVDRDMQVCVYDLAGLQLQTRLSLKSANDAPRSLYSPPSGDAVLVGTQRGVLLRWALDEAVPGDQR